MESLYVTYNLLLKERISKIRRGLLTTIDRNSRLIAVKGSRGVGKTSFLLEYGRTYFPDDNRCLYVNANNLFFQANGIADFIAGFYAKGGRILLMDQLHKYIGWDKELEACYHSCPDLRVVFTVSSTVRVKSNPNIGGIVSMYNLKGLSFREFIELETGHKFPFFSFEDIIKHHEEIAHSITSRVQPFLYLDAYLKYGYYPLYLEEKSYLDYLLKNINLLLEFDIPYTRQIDLAYLPKLKKLLYLLANNHGGVNITQLSREIGVSRATVLNYLHYMKDARLLTLLFDVKNKDTDNRKPNRVYMHDPNLLNAVCLETVDDAALKKSFFLSQICGICDVDYVPYADFLVNGTHGVNLITSVSNFKLNKKLIFLDDKILSGKGNKIPLWLTGFLY